MDTDNNRQGPPIRPRHAGQTQARQTINCHATKTRGSSRETLIPLFRETARQRYEDMLTAVPASDATLGDDSARGRPEGVAADEAQQPGLGLGVLGHLDPGPVLARGAHGVLELLHSG